MAAKDTDPRPVYAIDGEERLLVDEAVRAIREASVPARARDFNYDAFSGKEAALSRILEVAEMLPAFAQRRMVLVNDAEKLDLEGSETLLRYLERPNPSTVLVFVAEKFDARTKIYKAFQKAGAAIRFARPRPREVPDLLRARARAMGVAIDPPAIRALADAVGTDLGAGIQALELLSLYVGPGSSRAVTEDDVAHVVSVTREESIFALVDAIGTQDRSAALSLLHALLSVAREPALRVLAMVARHYRNLARARAALDRGASRSDIQALVGIPPYFLDGFLAQARRQPIASLASGISAIAGTDRALKGGPVRDLRAMERLVLALMREEGAGLARRL